MLKLLVILLVLCCSCLESFSKEVNFGDKIKDAEWLIKHINNLPGNTWKADLSFNPEMTLRDFSDTHLGLKGFRKGSGQNKARSFNPVVNFIESTNSENDDTTSETDASGLPLLYDARKKYPKCSTLKTIKDQSNCGSCWAVSIASALSDRFCIQSHSKISVNLSANYFAACSKKNYGCRGGYMDVAHDFLVSDGLVTGGDYESDEGCQPYEIAPCGRPSLLPCSVRRALTPRCVKNACTNEYHSAHPDKYYKAESYIKLPINETEIRNEIMKNGPVTAGFDVYLDFLFYRSGIYQARSGWYLGGHAVKIIGWGVEKGIKYWLVSNSWSQDWGDKGLFKIIRGRNECGFEEEVYGAIPLIH